MRYEHDCEACVLLGEWQEYDLYFCPKEHTVIARYGPYGFYLSGLPRDDKIEPLAVAKAVAVCRGFLP